MKVKTEIFVTKEHYLAFRKDWATNINEKNGHLESEHFLLFCILTETPVTKAFKPSKLECKQGFKDAMGYLSRYITKAKGLQAYDEGAKTKPSYMSTAGFNELMEKDRTDINRFLEPFGKGITISMLVKTGDYLPGLTNIEESTDKAA